MRKTIAIFGGSRRHGNTGHLIDWIAKDLDIEVVNLGDKEISPFDYEHKNSEDDFLPLMKHILEHENIIFVSPVYWFSMSAQMKIFIDRTSDFLDVEDLKQYGRELRGKVAYVVTTSISKEVATSYIDSFTDTFKYLGLSFGGVIHLNCENGFNREAFKTDVDEFILKLK